MKHNGNSNNGRVSSAMLAQRGPKARTENAAIWHQPISQQSDPGLFLTLYISVHVYPDILYSDLAEVVQEPGLISLLCQSAICKSKLAGRRGVTQINRTEHKYENTDVHTCSLDSHSLLIYANCLIFPNKVLIIKV